MPGTCTNDKDKNRNPNVTWQQRKGMWDPATPQVHTLLALTLVKERECMWIIPHQMHPVSRQHLMLNHKTYDLMPATSNDAQGWCMLKQQPSSIISISSRSCTRLCTLVVSSCLSEADCTDLATASWNCIMTAVSISYLTLHASQDIRYVNESPSSGPVMNLVTLLYVTNLVLDDLP